MTTIDKHAVTSELKRDSSLAMAAVKRFSSDQCTAFAASIAFYSAFSLAPMLLMVIAVAGWFFGAEAARGQLFSRVHDFLGNDAAAAIQAIVENAHRQGGGGFAAVSSLVLLIIGASATFSSLNTALDVVFPGPPSAKRSSLALLVRVRLVSFGLVLGVAFLLVVSLVLDTAVAFVGKILWGDSPFVIIGAIVQLILSLAILSLAFTALMKLLPDAHVDWRDAWVGGIVAAVLFTIGKKLFAIYLAHAGTASAFGAAGSLAVLLMWLYFSSAVLLLGAEFAAVKGGFGNRKDAAAAAAEAAQEGMTDDPHAAALPNAALARSAGSASSASAAAAPAGTAAAAAATASALPSSARGRNETGRSGAAVPRGARLATPATGRGAPRRGSVSTLPFVDQWIARSRYPVLLRVAAQTTPWLLRGAAILLRKRRKANKPSSSATRRGAASLMRFVHRGAPPAAEATRSPAVRKKAATAERGRYPLTAALFAAGTGLFLAALANRDRRS